ncbi:Transcriptional regulator, TetR family [Arcticibacter svalbardensis MN12-7]|uniref:Transcriptional regulator, TetR family n=1 Tax=Arcticibacter svalbardensis MN12-7 TaxID=1150600 RepID=R9GMF1_9SPHI|nr:TetR/AcrR family transcriptional regulator [Arcticibacter svalbardensis]EOR93017.1 Transcriptional regulator, TetR family [Arcticibacter svalbardensis MN12-7]
MIVKDIGKEQLIRDTAKHLFFSEGKLHATTQDIADAAGVNRTLVHYYFRSRNILFEQVVEEARLDLRNTIDSVLKAPLGFKEKLQKIISVFIDETTKYPFRELFVITETNRNKDLGTSKMNNGFIKSFMIEVKREMDAGNLKNMEPKQFIMNLFALMAYPVLASQLNKAILDIKEPEFKRLMKQRKQLIFEMLYIGN